MDQEQPGPDESPPTETIGRVNTRSAEDVEDPERWSLRAILLGILAVAIMVITLLIVLQWAIDAPTL